MTNQRRQLFFGAAVTVFFLTPEIASAQSPRASLHMGDLLYNAEHSSTAIAGHSGTSTSVGILGPHWMSGRDGDHRQAISEITWGERGDEPCYFLVVSHEIAQLQDGVNDCGAGDVTATRTVASYAERYYGLVGVRVCTNNRNNARGRLVKGIRATWAARPYLTGNQRLEITDQEVMPNCRNWTPTVRCPVGTAAPVIQLHRERIGGKMSMVGIKLRCYEVAPSCGWYEPGRTDKPLCWPNAPRGNRDRTREQ